MINILMCCSSLDTKGGMVSVVKNYLEYKNWQGVKITYIPTHFDTNRFLLIAYFFLRFVQIWYTVKTKKIDIAHLHVAERGSFWRKAFLLSFFHKNGIKVIFHHHGAEFELFYNECSNKDKDKVKKALEEADLNIVLSKRLAETIRIKAPNAHISVLYNSVNCYDSNPYNPDSKYILFLGRLGKRKGVFDLLTAIKNLDEKIPKEIKLLLCGDQGEQMVLEFVKKKDIEHRVEYIGWIDEKMKKKFIPNVMINCLPSYNEGLPMTILETMAAGIPNISTAIASIPEVIKDGENGYLIQPGDIETLSKKILSLISNNALRISFSEKAYQTVSNNFSLSNHIRELKGIYHSLNVL